MNLNRFQCRPFERVSRYFAFGFAAALIIPTGMAQAPEMELRALRAENAALRKRVAELEAVATTKAALPPAPTAAPEGKPASSPAAATVVAEGIQLLSPFVVTTENDFGYLKTNSATATRIDMEIQKIPLNISVLSEDFIADTGMREIQDVLRYMGSAAGDTRLGVKPPGNGATPSGTFSLRGFPVSSRLRNGLSRFAYYNMDTVERIEVIKGPAAVFFGQGFPGGVINYVTKQPEFARVPTTFSYSYGGNAERLGAERATIDQNTVMSKHVATRLVGVWDDGIGSQRAEYKKTFTVAPSMTVIPFDSGRLRLKAEFEYVQSRQNSDGQGWIYPDQWFADYQAPPAALIAASGVADASAYRARIFNNVGQWIADIRRVNQGNNLAANFDSNNNYVPPAALWTSIRRGAKYNQRDGTRVHDRAFNHRGVGSYDDNTDSTLAVTVEADPTSWLNARYTFTRNNSSYAFLTSQAAPYADGNRMNFSGLSHRVDQRDANTHQYDFVLRQERFGVKHKILLGGIYDHSLFSYGGASGFLFTNIPGVALPASGIPSTIVSGSGDPLFPSLTSTIVYNGTAAGGQTALQQVFNRDGRALTPAEIFQQYDPAIHPVPDIRRVTPIDRGLVDRYHPQREEYYLNYLATLMDDRLNLFAGYRTVNEYDGDERASANPPWYNGFENMGSVLDPAGQVANGISLAPGSYYLGTYLVKKGDSAMYGLSFALTKDVTLYASLSRTYLPNTGYLGLTDENLVRLKAASLGLNPDAEIARIRAAGSNDSLKNEDGKNYEFGLKTSRWDNKLVGTFSVFRLLRTNEKLDDTQRQIDEPLNYAAPNKGGAYSTGNGGVRWYSNSSSRKVEGAEAELIWTPWRNYQVLANGSWLWTARTIADPRFFDPARPPDGATAVQLQSNSQNTYFAYSFRLPNVPEYRFSMFNKYTFTAGRIRGLSLTFGLRHASVMNVANDINTDSRRGGVTAGDYVVFDGGASFPWNMFGFSVGTGLQISNLTDKEYNEGSGGLSGGGFMNSPPRTWRLTNTLKF